jgi:hypothetical protein
MTFFSQVKDYLLETNDARVADGGGGLQIWWVAEKY